MTGDGVHKYVPYLTFPYIIHTYNVEVHTNFILPIGNKGSFMTLSQVSVKFKMLVRLFDYDTPTQKKKRHKKKINTMTTHSP